MTHYRCLILPNLENELFLDVDLGYEVSVTARAADNENPMKNIEAQDELLLSLLEKYQTKYTIGGFLEDRSLLWDGFYGTNKGIKLIHLGIDINNLRVGQPVSLPCDGTVVHVMRDETKLNGWGGRIIFKMDQSYDGANYLLYGHLDHDLPRLGDLYRKGQIVGKLGNSSINGGWFVHLHVQLIKEPMMQRYANNLDLLDGYFLEGDETGNTVDEITADPLFLIAKLPISSDLDPKIETI